MLVSPYILSHDNTIKRLKLLPSNLKVKYLMGNEEDYAMFEIYLAWF